MKRLLALLFVLCLFWLTATPSFAEESPDVFSYDFDLRFHLDADIFPVRNRDHMQGIADLLNMLELKGNLTYCPATDSFDLNADVIPVTNPDASVSFRLYGIPSHMGISSPLLGNETIWLENQFMMEFAFKTWNNLKFPAQYLALLYPYNTETAFRKLSDAWNSRFGSVQESASFSRDDLESLSEEWDDVIHKDYRLKYWICSLSIPAEKGSVMETEFLRLPEYVLTQVCPEGGLEYVRDGESETWKNALDNVLLSRSSSEGSYEWALSLPPTESGYIPALSVRKETDGGLFSLSLEGSYNLAESAGGSRSSLPESLAAVSLDIHGCPVSWPQDTHFDALLQIGGILLPNRVMSFSGTGSADGSISVTLSEPYGAGDAVVQVLSCSGTVVQAVPSSVPDFSADDFKSFLPAFHVNDNSMDDFIHRIRKPLVLGVLNFLNELPARSCQSVMDVLEDHGVLDMVLVD